MVEERKTSEARETVSEFQKSEIILSKPLFLTVTREAVGNIDDTGTSFFSFQLRVEYGSTVTFVKEIVELTDEPGLTSIQELILQIAATLKEEGIDVQGTVNLRIQNDNSTFAILSKEKTGTSALLNSGIPFKGVVILHPRDGER